MKKFQSAITILLLISIAVVFTACGASETTAEDENVIKLGVTASETEVWDHIEEELAKEDITLEIVSFSDYTRPNIALADGEIDVNSFQHYAFFDNFKEEHSLDLTAIGETVIAPIGLYSSKIEDVSQLKEGDEITIPNDETNSGRALILLQSAGLIKLDEKAGNLPTTKDITENKLNLKITEIDAGTTARTLDDVAAAVINSGFAVDAGFIPTRDSIFLEPVNEDSKPYINIIAVRSEDKDNELYKKIVELYQTDEVEEIVNELYKGSQVTAW